LGQAGGLGGSMSKGKACWVYVLQCGDGSYYTGWTNDLAKRVMSHQSGKGGKYTRSRRPVRLIKKWRARDRSAAMRREALFKSLSRKEKSSVLGIKEFRG
jgi:putative endonuclease